MDDIKKLANLFGAIIEKYIDKLELDKLPNPPQNNSEDKKANS